MAPAQRHARRAGLVAASAFAFVPMVGISPAHACSCAGWDDAENYEVADVVFRGTLPSDTRTGLGRQPDDVVLSFTADRAYKGPVFATQQVRTSSQGAACGLELSGAGPFLVFAHTPKKADGSALAPLPGKTLVPEASLCGGTREIGASETLSFGEGNPVDPNPVAAFEEPDGDGRPALGGALPVVLFAGGTALLALPFLLRRRRRSPE